MRVEALPRERESLWCAAGWRSNGQRDNCNFILAHQALTLSVIALNTNGQSQFEMLQNDLIDATSCLRMTIFWPERQFWGKEESLLVIAFAESEGCCCCFCLKRKLFVVTGSDGSFKRDRMVATAHAVY